MLRIACVNNLSARAYLETPAPAGAVVSPMTPRDIARAVREGGCDAALLPVAALAHAHGYDDSLPFGIACTGEVMSVGLFSRLPLESLLANGAEVHVTKESVTSARLLEHLMQKRHGRHLPLCVEDGDAPAQLLIGDAAMMAQASGAWPCVYDLGAWWLESTGLPFVFARWVVRRGLERHAVARVSRWLEEAAALGASEAGLSRLCDASAGLAPRPMLDSYYRRLRLALTSEDLRAIVQFGQILEKTLYAA